VRTKGKQTVIVVAQKGRLPVPVVVRVTLADGTEDVLRQTARVWKYGPTCTFTKRYGQPIRQVTLGAPEIPDIQPEDNFYRPAASAPGK
jgi:hypothetical protein